jgi:hypothetical protein
MRVIHRDEVEEPFTEWLRQAYEYSSAEVAKPGPAPLKKPTPKKPTPKLPTPKNGPTPKKPKSKPKRRAR